MSKGMNLGNGLIGHGDSFQGPGPTELIITGEPLTPRDSHWWYMP